MLTWMLNATCSVGGLVAVSRVACSCGLVGWLVWAAALPTPWSPQSPGPVTDQPPAARPSPPLSVAPTVSVAPPVVAGPVMAEAPAQVTAPTPALSPVFSFIGPGLQPAGQAPPARVAGGEPQTGSKDDVTVQELLQLRQRLGGGLGNAEDFLEALEQVVQDQAAEAAAAGPNRPNAAVRPGPWPGPRVAHQAETLGLPPRAIQSGDGRGREAQPHENPPVLLPNRGFAETPVRPDPFPQQAVRPVAGFHAPVTRRPAHLSPESSQSLRRAARALEKAAWELEGVGDYDAADNLRRQAFELYRRSR
jgi:hypothetical protein